jgi:hypothetical protein
MEYHTKGNEICSDQVKLNYWKGNYIKIDEALQQINWPQVFDGKSADEMWISFETAVFELVDVYVPIKQDRRKKKGKWLSRATRKKMKKETKRGRNIDGTNQEEILRHIEGSEMRQTIG